MTLRRITVFNNIRCKICDSPQTPFVQKPEKPTFIFSCYFLNYMSMADKANSSSLHGDQLQTDYFSTAYRAAKKWASALVFFIVLVVGAFIFRIDPYFNILTTKSLKHSTGFPLTCTNESLTKTCNVNYPMTFEAHESSNSTCPDYFQWIHEDLQPWRSAGISRDMIERAKDMANFRLVIVKGKAYVETYFKSFQTRDMFTLWGFLQLLRLYPGRIPDLELMFGCGDMPRVVKNDYQGPNATSPPPLFQYCGHADHLSIIFPDWSFWGWAELSIKPWEDMLKLLVEGTKKKKWKDRVPYAYWKGNPDVSPNREDLMTCNVSDKHDWNARIYAQHYWPISQENKCRDIKFAVEWGNSHPHKAQAIGKAGSRFIEKNLKVEYVYAYMFHLLREYAKLLKFKPEIPAGGVEICSESMACPEEGLRRKFMVDSMVNFPSDTLPCNMPPPLEPAAIEALFERNENITRQVVRWQNEYWESSNKTESSGSRNH
ncbi:hypothetical protein MANES_01G259300v8 [Manihot esculenta]|uniref:Uncharacterized protein n=1 Tax=Manihot esculenta TaxID=3983 RepID=A0ACB7IIJ2_MANES|nr:hypothetical protein MANES_01G259300v8 [Manihot esculenta]